MFLKMSFYRSLLSFLILFCIQKHQNLIKTDIENFTKTFWPNFNICCYLYSTLIQSIHNAQAYISLTLCEFTIEINCYEIQYKFSFKNIKLFVFKRSDRVDGFKPVDRNRFENLFLKCIYLSTIFSLKFSVKLIVLLIDI